MLDKTKIGMAFEPHTVTVEAGRLAFFAKAAGYRSLPVPATYLFSLELERPDQFGWFAEVGLDLKKILHGEQSFVYHQVPVAGDTLTFASQITDIYEKKNGALEFVVRQTTVTDAKGAPVAELKSTIVQRNA